MKLKEPHKKQKQNPLTAKDTKKNLIKTYTENTQNHRETQSRINIRKWK